MLVKKGFKFRLVPTKEQKQKLLQHGGNSRFIWNLFLKTNID
jgi:transposase